MKNIENKQSQNYPTKIEIQRYIGLLHGNVDATSEEGKIKKIMYKFDLSQNEIMRILDEK